MVQNLVFFGDSFTSQPFDEENPDRAFTIDKEVCVTNRLEELTGINSINFSSSGKSTTYITTLFTKFYNKFPDLAKNSIFFFCLTCMHRGEFNNRKNKEVFFFDNYKNKRSIYTNYGIPKYNIEFPSNNSKSREYIEHLTSTTGIPYKEFKNFYSLYYSKFSNNTAVYWENIQRLQGLQAFIKEKNLKAVVFQGLDPMLFTDGDYLTEEQRKKDNIRTSDNISKYIDLFKFPGGHLSWAKYIYSYDSKYHLGHPNSYDHKLLGDILYEHIKDLL